MSNIDIQQHLWRACAHIYEGPFRLSVNIDEDELREAKILCGKKQTPDAYDDYITQRILPQVRPDTSNTSRTEIECLENAIPDWTVKHVDNIKLEIDLRASEATMKREMVLLVYLKDTWWRNIEKLKSDVEKYF